MIASDKLAERGIAKEIRRAINRLNDRVRASEIREGLGYKYRRSSTRTVLEIPRARDGKSGELDVIRVQVSEVYPTYLRCQRISDDGTSLYGNPVWVWRPYGILKSDTASIPPVNAPDDSEVTVTISDTTDSANSYRILNWTHDSEVFAMTQYVTPRYVASGTAGSGSLLFVIRNVDGLSTPWIAPLGYAAQRLEWLDLNVDARHWSASRLRYVEVCVSGETKHMWVEGSEVGEPE